MVSGSGTAAAPTSVTAPRRSFPYVAPPATDYPNDWDRRSVTVLPVDPNC